MLLESGSKVLLESGSVLLLEDGGVTVSAFGKVCLVVTCPTVTFTYSEDC